MWMETCGEGDDLGCCELGNASGNESCDCFPVVGCGGRMLDHGWTGDGSEK